MNSLNEAIREYRDQESTKDETRLMMDLLTAPEWNDFSTAAISLFLKNVKEMAKLHKTDPREASVKMNCFFQGALDGAFIIGYRARELRAAPEPPVTVQ